MKWTRTPPSTAVRGTNSPAVRLHDAIYSLFIQGGGTPPPIEFVQWPMPELIGGDAGLRTVWRYPRPATLAEFKPSDEVIDPDTMANLDAAWTLEPTAAAWCDDLYLACGELYRAVVRKADPVPLFRRRASPSNSGELRRVTGVHEFGGVTDWWRALFPPDFGDDQPWQMTLDDARWAGCVRIPLRENPGRLGIYELWLREADLERFARVAPSAMIFKLAEAVEHSWGSGVRLPAETRDWIAQNCTDWHREGTGLAGPDGEPHTYDAVRKAVSRQRKRAGKDE